MILILQGAFNCMVVETCLLGTMVGLHRQYDKFILGLNTLSTLHVLLDVLYIKQKKT